MKKLISAALIIALIAVCVPMLSHADVRTYKITATVPAIIGVNTGISTASKESQEKTFQLAGNIGYDTLTEEVWRNNEKVVLKTIVAR